MNIKPYPLRRGQWFEENPAAPDPSYPAGNSSGTRHLETAREIERRRDENGVDADTALGKKYVV